MAGENCRQAQLLMCGAVWLRGQGEHGGGERRGNAPGGTSVPQQAVVLVVA